MRLNATQCYHSNELQLWGSYHLGTAARTWQHSSVLPGKRNGEGWAHVHLLDYYMSWSFEPWASRVQGVLWLLLSVIMSSPGIPVRTSCMSGIPQWHHVIPVMGLHWKDPDNIFSKLQSFKYCYLHHFKLINNFAYRRKVAILETTFHPCFFFSFWLNDVIFKFRPQTQSEISEKEVFVINMASDWVHACVQCSNDVELEESVMSKRPLHYYRCKDKDNAG